MKNSLILLLLAIGMAATTAGADIVLFDAATAGWFDEPLRNPRRQVRTQFAERCKDVQF